MASGLTLRIAGLSVFLEQLTRFDLPRIRANIGQITHTSSGTPVEDGSFYEPRHIWEFQGLVTPEQQMLLSMIFSESDHRRRNQIANTQVFVDDETQVYTERFPRTRKLVPGASVINQPSVDPTHVAYYARFQARFTKEPQFTWMGIYYECRFSMLETKPYLVADPNPEDVP